MRQSDSLRRVLMVIMDGIGVRETAYGNAVSHAYTPAMDYLRSHSLYTTVNAHGPWVGLPSDNDIGNSEVGHNALGAGRVFDQGAKLVQQSLSNGTLFHKELWQNLVKQNSARGTLHFIGLLSDGNVHSHESHLHALMREAAKSGIKRIRVHVLLDGRDVEPRSAEIYLERLESEFTSLREDFKCDVEVASGGGRMTVTMDRYEADWGIVERGWKAHVLGEAPYHFESSKEALQTLRNNLDLDDQFLPPFIITKNGNATGPILDGDGVVFFNFRGDRALEVSKAFEDKTFTHFDRIRKPDVLFCGMLEYDGDLHIPKHYLVSPPEIKNTLSETLVTRNIRQFACSETQKYGHVTYFWNGNRSGYIDKSLEEYLEIPSDNIGFEQKPWMKAHEITEDTIKRMRTNTFDFGRINYANGDMVGHTGDFDASIVAVSTVDLMLTRLIKEAQKTDTILLVTADHGNCEDMFSINSKSENLDLINRPTAKTSHTLSQVPCYIFDPRGALPLSINPQGSQGLANLANTVLVLLGLEESDNYLPSLFSRKT